MRGREEKNHARPTDGGREVRTSLLLLGRTKDPSDSAKKMYMNDAEYIHHRSASMASSSEIMLNCDVTRRGEMRCLKEKRGE